MNVEQLSDPARHPENNKMTGGRRTSSGCPDKSFDARIYGYFYDEQCARDLLPFENNDEFSSVCGVEVINDALK